MSAYFYASQFRFSQANIQWTVTKGRGSKGWPYQGPWAMMNPSPTKTRFIITVLGYPVQCSIFNIYLFLTQYQYHWHYDDRELAIHFLYYIYILSGVLKNINCIHCEVEPLGTFPRPPGIHVPQFGNLWLGEFMEMRDADVTLALCPGGIVASLLPTTASRDTMTD